MSKNSGYQSGLNLSNQKMAKILCFLQVVMIHCTKEKWCNDQNGIVLVQTIVHKEDVKVFN